MIFIEIKSHKRWSWKVWNHAKIMQKILNVAFGEKLNSYIQLLLYGKK